jgi:cell wall-associated NlpC family hydrolase
MTVTDEHTGGTARTPTGATTTAAAPGSTTTMQDPELAGPLIEPNEVFDEQAFQAHWADPRKAASARTMGEQIALAGDTWIGTPYVWGGTTLGDGADCSGFIQTLYKGFGVDLPRVSFQQMAAGTQVDYKGAQAGDLWGIDNSERNHGVDHIAVYIGNNEIIEAPRTGLNIRRRKLSPEEIRNGYFSRVLH